MGFIGHILNFKSQMEIHLVGTEILMNNVNLDTCDKLLEDWMQSLYRYQNLEI